LTKKHKDDSHIKTEEHPAEKPGIAPSSEQLAEKDRLIDEMKNKYLRVLADLDNYKKRANLEKEELAKFSNEILVKELLPAVDGFARAIDFAKKTNNDDLIKGISLVKKQVEDALMKFGVKEIVSVGKPYDAHLQEAIFMKESDGDPGIVLEETQKGYTMHERLIRPAMVVVSKNKEEKK
jgi:molecular chaperone GrpE